MTDIDGLAREAVQRAKREVATVDVPEADRVVSTRRTQHRTRMAVATLALVIVLGGGAAVAVAASGGGKNATPPVEVQPKTTKASIEFRLVESQRPCSQPTHGPGSVTEFPDRKNEFCFVAPKLLLDGSHVTDASTTLDPSSGWIILLQFDNNDFATRVAQPYVNRNVAIVVNGMVQSAPKLNPGITGRDVQITGDMYSETEAKALVADILHIDPSAVRELDSSPFDPSAPVDPSKIPFSGLALIPSDGEPAVPATLADIAAVATRSDTKQGWVVVATLRPATAQRLRAHTQFTALLENNPLDVERAADGRYVFHAPSPAQWDRARAEAVAQQLRG